MLEQLSNHIFDKQFHAFQEFNINFQRLALDAHDHNQKMEKVRDSQLNLNSRDTPINGFKYVNQKNENQNSSNFKSSKLQPETNKSSLNVNAHSVQVYDKMSVEQCSILTNKQNPEQLEASSQVRNTHSEHPNLKTKNKPNQVINKKILPPGSNRPKNSQNYLPKIGKSVKTQNKSRKESQKSSRDVSDLERQFTRIEGAKKKSNIKINSNVVSYCQSLNQSSVGGLSKASNSCIQSDMQQKEIKKPGYIRLRKIRYKTEQNKEKAQKQIEKQIEQFRLKQLQLKSQLRLVFDKKKKIQQKLKNLNSEIVQIQNSEISKRQINCQDRHLKNSYITQKSRISELFPEKRYQNYQISSKQQKHREELQKSRKAIQFVEKVSKESLRRRIENQKKIKEDIQNRVKHACVDCSRVQCQIEVAEGEVRKQMQVPYKKKMK